MTMLSSDSSTFYVAFILDGGGNGLEKYTYDAFGTPTITDWWGNPHVTAGNEPQSWYGNRFMFQGREYLSELAIYDFRNRIYDPSLGRFLQIDPLSFGGGDVNLFRYCGGDPVNRRDPTGLRGPDPRFNSEGIDSGALGAWNWGLGSGSGPASTQGFWSTPGGFPTGLGSGSSGGDSNQGGGNNSGGASGGVSYGYVEWESERVVVEADMVRTDSSPAPVTENFGFLPSEISLWNPKIDFGRLDPFFTFGRLRIDVDGSLTPSSSISKDPKFAGSTSALKDADGNYVVASKGVYGVDASTDPYAVAPAYMFRLGDTVTVINLNNGATSTMQIGDYGSNSHWFGEVSLFSARELGANIKMGSDGPVTVGPDIPVMIIVYPGTGH